MDPGHAGADLDDRQDWPELLREIADIIGPELTLTLADACGGIAVAIPKTPGPNHLWAKAIGVEAFAKLVHAFGGQRLELQRGRFLTLRKRRIIELAEQGGLSVREIALQAHTTERNVRRVLGDCNMRSRVDPRQTKLPFG